MENIREKLAELALADAVNSNRASDALREALVGALLKKAGEMSPQEIFDAIDRIDKMETLSKHKKVLDLLGNS